MIGRTHGVHAEPMTFGLKLALWYAEMLRDIARVDARARDVVSVGKISGAVGTFAHLDPAIEARMLRAARAASRRRSPRRSSSAIGTPSCWPRSPSPAASLEKFALEIRGPAEDRDRRGRGAVRARARRARRRCRTSATRSAASRSPGWRGCCAPTRMAALENIALWHERDISHSSVERVILPDSFIALDHMLRRFTRIVRGHGRAPRSHAREPGALARRGVLGHRAAGAGAARACRASRPTNGCSATRCASSDERPRLQGAAAGRSGRDGGAVAATRSSGAFDLDDQLRHVDTIFERVFAVRPGGEPASHPATQGRAKRDAADC